MTTDLFKDMTLRQMAASTGSKVTEICSAPGDNGRMMTCKLDGVFMRLSEAREKLISRMEKPAAVKRARIEVGTGTGYRWHDGYQLFTPEGNEMQPCFESAREVMDFCKSVGWIPKFA